MQDAASEAFFKRLDRARSKIESYIKDPSETNVHDARIAIRRLESAYSTVPKSQRTKKSDRLVSRYADFFSLNSPVRDLDIILQKLESYGYDRNTRMGMLANRKRIKSLLRALPAAGRLAKSKRPKLKGKPARSRLQKRTLAMLEEFRGLVPAVLADESDKDVLHSMRKTVKKMRYLLEQYPDNPYDTLIVNIRTLQGMLGAIRDSDVFITYLGKNMECPGVPGMIKSEKKVRTGNYQELVRSLSGF